MIDPRKRIGRYEICSQLGAGGMGEVYLAQDTKLDRKVALKLLPADIAEPDRARRFEQEAKATSALNHPNILTIYEIDEVDQDQFMVTEFVEGETLRERIRISAFKLDEAIDVGIQIANALSAAHEIGIVHRDIKPDNIMVRPDGLVKVLDFGLAKLSREANFGRSDPEAKTQALMNTEAGTVLGTAHYMSPEQARGLELDARTDIWSLGCVLYEMVSTRRPFHGSTTVDVLSGILHLEPEPLATHPGARVCELERIISRALHKDRDARYQTVRDLLAELRDLKYQLEVESRSGPTVLSREMASGENASFVPEKSIAVLYFENLNAERDSDYFCAGITEDIITDLSKINELKIVSRTDVLPFRKKEINIRQVGEALRVNYILEGSVRTAGNRIRINTTLVNVRDGYHLWAERFDRELEDIFELQNEVSQKIVAALKISLTEIQKQLLTKKPTDDLKAYDFFMRGREMLYLKGKRNTENAIKMFEAAVGLDKEFASSYAGLAEAYSYMYEWYDGHSSWLTKAIEMNQLALNLDPTSLEAQFGIAMVYFHHRRFAEANRVIDQILSVNPDFYPGYLRLGMILELSGDLDQALKYYCRAAELKPYDEDPWRFLVGVHRRLNNTKAAAEAAMKVIEVTSKKLEASVDDIIVMSRLAEAYARFGSTEEALATLRRVFELEPNDGLAVYNCACAYAILGEKRTALVCLHRAYDNGFKTVAHWARTDSAFDSIREDSDFQQIVAGLN